MVMSCFKLQQKHNLCSAFFGKNPSLTGCNQNDIGLRHAAIACMFLSCQDIEPQVELPLHRETSYAGARLAFAGKELQHHTVVNTTKLKTLKIVFCRRQVGIWRQGAAEPHCSKSVWSY